MKLNTLNAKGFDDRIKWCGPTALALITGRTLRFCHNKIAKIRGIQPRHLKGAYNHEMKQALSEMGYEAIPIVGPYRHILAGHRKTLRAYIEEHQPTAEFRGVVLLNVTGHYVVAHNGTIADNRDDGQAKPVREHWSKRKMVHKAWLIKKRKK